MTSRKTLDQMTSNDLDRLYNDLKIVTDRACRDSEDLVRTEAERDGAYRERAHLVALLTTHYPTVITPALDLDEAGWWIAYLTIGDRQCSWHISPRDAGLFAHVERVEPDDPRARWDGHTTDAKYEWLRKLAALRAPAPITDIEDRTVCTCTFDTRCGCGTSVHYQPAPGPVAAQAADAGRVIPIDGDPAAAHEAVRQMDADTTQPHTGLVVQPYTDHGLQRWVFRCWGTKTCGGLLSLGHTSQEWAERARDRHVHDEHPTEEQR